MRGFKTFIAAALLSTVAAATPAFAYSFMDEYPEVYQATHPERDVLNGGALTPAGRMGLERLELPYGAAPAFSGQDADPAFGNARASFRAYHHR